MLWCLAVLLTKTPVCWGYVTEDDKYLWSRQVFYYGQQTVY